MSNKLLTRLVLITIVIHSGFVFKTRAADKDAYHLFNPVPRSMMRDLSADRPDLTESPYTVDAGHLQVEMDFLRYSYDRHTTDPAGAWTESWSVAPINLKAGLLNRVDLQLVLEPFTEVRTKGPGGTAYQRGFGDVMARLKINLWGNDEGRTAFGVMPFVKAPTNEDDLGNDAVEGGIIFPLAIELGSGWGMGLMTEFDFLEDSNENGYHTEFVNTVVFGHSIAGKLSGYGEFFSAVSTESDSEWVGALGLGLTYLLNEDVQFDLGLNIGLTRAAEDLAPFAGLTWRF